MRAALQTVIKQSPNLVGANCQARGGSGSGWLHPCGQSVPNLVSGPTRPVGRPRLCATEPVANGFAGQGLVLVFHLQRALLLKAQDGVGCVRIYSELIASALTRAQTNLRSRRSRSIFLRMRIPRRFMAASNLLCIS
jgi:hypothetical protein